MMIVRIQDRGAGRWAPVVSSAGLLGYRVLAVACGRIGYDPLTRADAGPDALPDAQVFPPAEHPYWADPGAEMVGRVPLGGGPQETVATGVGANDIAIDARSGRPPRARRARPRRRHDLSRARAAAEEPITGIREVATELGLTYPTVASALERMSQLGMVRELTGHARNRLFAYSAYVDLLSEGTEPLAQRARHAP
jgi:hypothetical protein